MSAQLSELYKLQPVDMIASRREFAGPPVGEGVTQWVRQHLRGPIEIEQRTGSRVIGYVFLFFWAAIAGIGLTVALSQLGLTLLTGILIVVAVGLPLLIVRGLKSLKKNVPKRIDHYGITTATGRQLAWSSFIGAKYIIMRMSKLTAPRLFSIQLYFEGGTLVLAPTTLKNEEEVVPFIQSLPGKHFREAS